MPTTTTNRRLNLVGTLIASAFSLCALALPLSSARAQGCLGLDLGGACVGLGQGSWYYDHPYYYGYPYYGYPYYGYPAYSYPYRYHPYP